jgi:GDP-4-dehydro-6-deoxy-D-mannose reductase
MPATMLVLGASGFVGSHLVAAARDAGLDVFETSRQGGGGALRCDLLDRADLEACLDTARPDVIVNAAGAASVGRSWEEPEETFAANATGTLNLLDAVVGRAPEAHVICLSSADVYGIREPAELPLGEGLETRPVTPYGTSKVAMEMVCGEYAKRGMRITVARVFNLVGPGQSPEFAVPGFARRIAAAECDGEVEVELALGNGDAVRDFVDVRDGAWALVEIGRRGLHGTCNLCTGKGTTIAELAGELAAAARVPVTVSHDPALERPADPPALVGDPARLRGSIGFESRPLAASLSDLLEEWRSRPASA